MADADGKNHLKERTMNGNVQAMREALLCFVHDFASFRSDVEHGNLHMMQCMDFVNQYIPLMESALSAPPRNCDVFGSEAEARSAFIAYYNEVYDLEGSKYAIDTGDLKHDVDGILHDYIQWLFAPAKAETKGEDNGSI